jgi:FlaA1/EpsC-like NDP-sugar epimerase
VLGYSKRVTERLTSFIAAEHSLPYVSVRFGNVLGSNGSVVTIFASQIAAGGPLTVTDPEITRYFMTAQEAVELVLQAGALGSGGDVLVLDMGEPVRIVDVARRLAARAGTKPGNKKIDIVYTGLSVGEKMHEALFGLAETDDRPHHPLISEVPVPPLDPRIVVEIDPWAEPEQVRAVLVELGRDSDLAAGGNLSRIPRQPASPDSAAPRR